MARIIFPAGGHATMRMVDELLAKLGVLKHDTCAAGGQCEVGIRYRWARDEMLAILRFESVAARQQR